MKKIAPLTALALAVALHAGPAAAQFTAAADNRDDVRIGLGVACDTEHQIERYASLLGGKGSAEAIQIVNEEAQNPRACGAVAIAYKVSKQVNNVRNEKGIFKIVEIVVVAASAPGGHWQMINPQPTQYIAVREVEA